MINENFKIPQSLRSFGMTTNCTQHEMRRRSVLCFRSAFEPPHTLFMQKACHSERSEESRTNFQFAIRMNMNILYINYPDFASQNHPFKILKGIIPLFRRLKPTANKVASLRDCAVFTNNN